MKKIIFVLLDGLTLKAGNLYMPFLSSLCSTGHALRGEIRTAPPTLSRPVYATIISGLPPDKHHIMRNEDDHIYPDLTIFSLLRQAGLRACAAAYHWFYELANGSPYEPPAGMDKDEAPLPAGSSIFYRDDAYPDERLMADAETLRRKYHPDLLLVHCMGVDFAGHAAGGESSVYRQAAATQDRLLAGCLPRWRQAGYEVMIASDHGMDAAGNHNEPCEVCVRTPLWLVGNWTYMPAGHASIAPLIASMLGLEWPHAADVSFTSS